MRVRAGFVLLLATGGIVACASVWGFEDATPADATDGGDGGVIVDDEVVPAEGAPGVVCVPRGPADWQGPLLIYESVGNPAPAPPPCPSTHPKATDSYANVAPGSCACTCTGAPTGVTCSLPVLSIYNDQAGCTAGGAGCKTFPLSPVGTCSAYPDAGCNAQDTWTKVTTPSAPVGGSCAQPGPGVLDPIAWGATARVCAPPASVPGTCPPDKVPTPQAELPYQTNYCIAVTGTAACPALYPKQRVYYTGATDKRACQCSCSPKGGTCTPSIELRDDSACGGALKGNPTAGACVGATNASSIHLLDPGTPTGTTCQPSSTVTGDVQPSGPLTICCRR